MDPIYAIIPIVYLIVTWPISGLASKKALSYMPDEINGRKLGFSWGEKANKSGIIALLLGKLNSAIVLIAIFHYLFLKLRFWLFPTK